MPDWYRLLELCGITDTLIADNDGVYRSFIGDFMPVYPGAPLPSAQVGSVYQGCVTKGVAVLHKTLDAPVTLPPAITIQHARINMPVSGSNLACQKFHASSWVANPCAS